jgi:phenylacetate-CoA ligase
MRAEIERLLAIEAHDIYGLSEIAGPGVSYDCGAFDGLHVCEDYFYPEIIDPDTLEPLPDGAYGELVFTCIGKEALPLVRYRTRDISALVREKCSCGRSVVRMHKPKGRSDDMLIIRGVNVFPSQVEHVILDQGFEPNYQIVVERIDNLDVMTVMVELSDAVFSDSMADISSAERRLKNAMLSTLGVSASIKLVDPRSLPRSEGKAVRVIDKRGIIDYNVKK